MKRFGAILIMFIIVFLYGCSENADKENIPLLDMPTNIQLTGNQLSWKAVLYAELYEVKIGNEVADTSKTFYNLVDLVEGEKYIISVRAYTDSSAYRPSFWSEPINYIHSIEMVTIPLLETPHNLSCEEGVVSWDEVPYAVNYEISLGTTIITTDNTIFELPEMIPGQTYRIMVRAIGNDIKYCSSLWSGEINVYIPLGDKTILDTPTIIGIEQGVISWTEIENSEGYQIEVNNVLVTVHDTEASLDWLIGDSVGKYSIRVKANASLLEDYYDSLWSAPFGVEWDGQMIYLLEGGARLKTFYESEGRYEGRGDLLFPDYQATYEELFDVYYFYIGAIDQIPLVSSDAYFYNSDGLSPIISNINTSAANIESNLRLALSSIQIVPYSGSKKVNLVDQYGSSEGMTKVQSGFKNFNNNLLSQNWPDQVGRVNPNLSRFSQYIDNSHMIRYVFNEEGFTQGYSYRETIYGTADVFVTINYQRSTQTYNYKYEMVLKDDKNLRFVTEKSDENGSFVFTVDNCLSFDIDSAMDYIAENSNKNQKLWSDVTMAAHLLGFDYGDGSIANPYIIGGMIKPANEQFLLINNHLTKAFKLTTDVNLSSYNPTQFSSVIRGNFSGQLDGNGKTIKGLQKSLYITSLILNTGAGYKYRIGLFEHLGNDENKVSSTSIIKNLIIENFAVYFNNYQDDPNSSYAFGLLVASSNGIIDNVTVKSSRLEVYRSASVNGLIVGVFHGEITNSHVTSSELHTNGDGGGLVGTNRGKVANCTFKNGSITYRFVGSVERSVGGIVGHLKSSDLSTYPAAIVTNCVVHDTTFYNYHANSWLDWFTTKYYSPKTGIIVGHAQKGFVISVGQSGVTHNLMAGHKGNHHFAVGWGWAGYQESSVTVS